MDIHKICNGKNKKGDLYAKINIKANKNIYEEEKKENAIQLITRKADTLGSVKNYNKLDVLKDENRYFIAKISTKN